MSESTTEQKEQVSETVLRRHLWVNGCLFILYACIAVYAIFSLATARPNLGNLMQLLLILMLFGVLRRGVFFAYAYLKKTLIGHRFIISLGLLVLALLLTNVTSRVAASISRDRMIEAYQPLVDAMHVSLVLPCTADNEDIQLEANTRPEISYSGITGLKGIGRVHFALDYFVIEVTGGSIDIDGSVFYYNSKNKKWKLFHNDVFNDRNKFEELVKNLRVCNLQ